MKQEASVRPEHLLEEGIQSASTLEAHNGREYSCERKVFQSVGLNINTDFEVHHVPIAERQTLYAVRVRFAPTKPNQTPQIFYLTHGFGGTCLFFYDLVPILRQYGEVVLFDLRGMGLSDKVEVPYVDMETSLDYFVQPMEILRRYFKHNGLSLVAHSFGSYVCMLYASQHPQNVKKLVMFSPIGVTPKQQDYKSRISSCGDLLHYLLSQVGWGCHLTWKNILKWFVCCCQRAALNHTWRDYGNPQQKVENLTEIALRLMQEPLCSEKIFFKIFEPRVLPVYNLEEHYRHKPPQHPMKLVYGSTDWVDRQGAKRISQRYQHVKYLEVADSDHQIFFTHRPEYLDNLIKVILM